MELIFTAVGVALTAQNQDNQDVACRFIGDIKKVRADTQACPPFKVGERKSPWGNLGWRLGGWLIDDVIQGVGVKFSFVLERWDGLVASVAVDFPVSGTKAKTVHLATYACISRRVFWHMRSG